MHENKQINEQQYLKLALMGRVTSMCLGSREVTNKAKYINLSFMTTTLDNLSFSL
jgi:hypothetical protein